MGAFCELSQSGFPSPYFWLLPTSLRVAQPAFEMRGAPTGSFGKQCLAWPGVSLGTFHIKSNSRSLWEVGFAQLSPCT